MELFDTHTHLESFARRGDLPAVLERVEPQVRQVRRLFMAENAEDSAHTLGLPGEK